MPAYEYQCNACGFRFEQRQKMSDPPIEICPQCGDAVKRLISGGAGMISKGEHASYSEAGATCGLGGPCCGQQGSACGGNFCGDE